MIFEKKNYSVSSHKVLLVYSGKVDALSPKKSENIDKNKKNLKYLAFNKIFCSQNPRFFTPKINHSDVTPSGSLAKAEKTSTATKLFVGNHQGFKSFHGKLYTNKRLELVGKPVSKSSKLIGKETSVAELQEFPLQSVILPRNMKKNTKEIKIPKVHNKQLCIGKSVKKLPSLDKKINHHGFQDLKVMSLERVSRESPDISETRRKSRREIFEKVLKMSSSIS
jgi:hypothetical protein